MDNSNDAMDASCNRNAWLIEIEIDHDVMTEEKLHQINNFWSDSEYRLNKHGSVLNAVLIMLAQHALLIAISSDLNAYGVVCEFDWNDGNGQEGWPPMDGSEGIRITDIDTSGIFDSDDMTREAVDAYKKWILIQKLRSGKSIHYPPFLFS